MIFEWAKLVLSAIASWPVAAIVIALLFRRIIREFLPTIRKGKVGPVEWERVEAAVDEIERLHLLIAKARLAELRAVDASQYAPSEHKPALREIADELQRQIELLEKTPRKNGV